MAVVMITHAFHDFWNQSKRWWLWSVIAFVLLVTLVFDFILAIHISQKIHEVKKLAGLIPETEKWTFRIGDLNMWTVIFCGFVVALFVSILYPATIELWKGVRPRRDESEQLEIQIRSERSSTEKRIATLKAEMENSQDKINQLNKKVESTQQKIDRLSRQQQETRIKEAKTPIETQIAVLKAEMENLQDEINQLNEKVKNIQREIGQSQEKIEELSARRNRRIVNGNKMESQVNQFLNGWCRFVAHSADGTTDVSAQINRIRQVAYETLNQYYENSPDYFSQS